MSRHDDDNIKALNTTFENKKIDSEYCTTPCTIVERVEYCIKLHQKGDKLDTHSIGLMI